VCNSQNSSIRKLQDVWSKSCGQQFAQMVAVTDSNMDVGKKKNFHLYGKTLAVQCCLFHINFRIFFPSYSLIAEVIK